MAGKFRRTRVLLSGGILVAAAWGGTMALFTDAQAASTGSFTTGRVALSVSSVSTSLALSNMAPGDTVTAPLTVTNSGSLALRYAMSSASAGDSALASALSVAIKSGVADCSNGGFGASGSSVTTGTLASVGFGDPTAGAQTGDRVLPSGSETLCFQVKLPTTADNSLQGGKTASATFTFSAEQTANN